VPITKLKTNFALLQIDRAALRFSESSSSPRACVYFFTRARARCGKKARKDTLQEMHRKDQARYFLSLFLSLPLPSSDSNDLIAMIYARFVTGFFL